MNKYLRRYFDRKRPSNAPAAAPVHVPQDPPAPKPKRERKARKAVADDAPVPTGPAVVDTLVGTALDGAPAEPPPADLNALTDAELEALTAPQTDGGDRVD